MSDNELIETEKDQLNTDSITFGKYKDNTLQEVLKDRSYCKWLLKQEWFEKNYTYLHKRVLEYEPLSYFTQKVKDEETDFISSYKFFHLKPVDEIELPLTDDDKKCYEYYLLTVDELKTKLLDTLGTDKPYNIKAPYKWLQRFEKSYELPRTTFKQFINSYELPNIPYIVERIKKEGGLEYKGAQSFNIAKKRSLEQEAFWEKILKTKYKDSIGTQFTFKNCIFDFINIELNTIFECKLGLKDFDLSQYKKYKVTLDTYKIIYLVGYDCVINMEKGIIYTTDYEKYNLYKLGLVGYCLDIGNKNDKKIRDFDNTIKDYEIVEIEEIQNAF